MKTLKKALTYRALSLLATSATGFLMTGSLTAALGMGLVDGVAKMGLYAAHEAAWEKLGSDDDDGDDSDNEL